MSDQEPITMREIREVRKRLMERFGGDDRAYFKHLMERQKELAQAGRIRLVRPVPVR